MVSRIRVKPPHSCPHKTSSFHEEVIVELHQKHPFWGPKKLNARLKKLYPQHSWPAPSTCGEILNRHGLSQKRKRRQRTIHPGQPHASAHTPNEVWATDFKGEFATGDGKLCYPLTISDLHSRYLLRCQALTSTAQQGAKEVFEELFRENGLPDVILSDNVAPGYSFAMLRPDSHCEQRVGVRLE